MSSRALQDIQRSLNAIRGELEQTTWETRLEALQLMLSTSEAVVAMARKLGAPKRRSVKARKAVPAPIKSQHQKTVQATPKASVNTVGFGPSQAPQRPTPPLGSQRNDPPGAANDR